MRKLLIFLTIAFVATPVFAQWRRAGLHGADVRALIVDPSHPDTLFLGTSGGEVYVSNDGAKNWLRPRNGAPFPGYVVDNLVIDRKGNLWAAAWGLWGGGVIAVSSDGGRSWVRRDSGLEDFSVRAIAVDPKDEHFLVAGGLTGVYRSADAGKSWTKISDQINVESLAIDPRHRDRIYIGTWRQGWRTDDGARSWKHIAEGMVLDTDMFSITIDPQRPDNVWVATCGWVYNSKNGGDLWTRYRDGFENRRIHDVEIDPVDPNVVWAGSVAGLYRSNDAGVNWSRVSDDRLVVNSIVLHPKRPDRVILGVEGDGVYVSNDRGTTFERMSDGLANLRIATIAPDPFEKQRVYAAVVFGGTASGIYRSDDGGENWQRASRTPLPDVLALNVAAERDASPKFIAGTDKGFFFSEDGEEWKQAEPASFPIRVEKLVRFNRSRSFAATSEGVFTTRDGGRSWYRLADAKSRAVDVAIATLGQRRALYALTSSGLAVFDGERWETIRDAPTGRTIAVRNGGGGETVFVAGSAGVKAGTIEGDRWIPADAPDAQYASVHGGSRTSGQMLFLSSRARREILVGEPAEDGWLELTLPVSNAEITAIVPDPFTRDRYYVGTFGEGLFVFDGKPRRISATKTAGPTGVAGAQ